MNLAAVVIPSLHVDVYGATLLSVVAGYVVALFPYAAAVTGVVVAAWMVKRWLVGRGWQLEFVDSIPGERKAQRDRADIWEAQYHDDDCNCRKCRLRDEVYG